MVSERNGAVPVSIAPIAGLPEGYEPRRVAIIKPSALGDVVMSLPVLNAARQAWPNARISWVINKGLVGLLEHHPAIDELITFDRKGFGEGIGGAMRFAKWLWSLRQHNFDMVLDLQGLLRSGLMSRATGAKYRVGLAESREGSRWFYTHHIPTLKHKNEDIHAVDRLMKVAETMGFVKPAAEPNFFWPRTLRSQAWARKTLEDLPRPWVGYTLGARWQTKRWPVEQFVKLVDQVQTSFGGSVILIGSPEDVELSKRFTAVAGNRFGRITDLAGKTTLPELQSMCGELDLLVSNDTGPLHVASAQGTPTVGIFTCTRPARTAAYAENTSCVTTKVDCAGNLLKSCSHTKCFAELEPRRVYVAVANQLHELGFGTRSAVA
ncbi:glycosyltransferase family 9 protein [bacterium]|nr:glycosyltransferase family 9 protein [bacterium]